MQPVLTNLQTCLDTCCYASLHNYLHTHGFTTPAADAATTTSRSLCLCVCARVSVVVVVVLAAAAVVAVAAAVAAAAAVVVAAAVVFVARCPMSVQSMHGPQGSVATRAPAQPSHLHLSNLRRWHLTRRSCHVGLLELTRLRGNVF